MAKTPLSRMLSALLIAIASLAPAHSQDAKKAVPQSSSTAKNKPALRDSSANRLPAWTLTVVGDSTVAVTGVSFPLKARVALAAGDSTLKFSFRWDFDGNGVWDFPLDGGYGSDAAARYAWPRPGNYRIAVEARDTKSRTASAAMDLLIHAEVEIDSIIFPGQIYAFSPVRLTCHATAYRGRIAEYAWDFNNDGKYDTVMAGPSVEHVFYEEGLQILLCRVMDDAGRAIMHRQEIRVQNAPAVVKAGGPYRVQVNAPLWVAGQATDPDNRIVSYSWDFDGDGKPEWSSSENTRVQYAYSISGRFTAAFTITTDDGRIAADSTLVEVYNQPPKAFAGEDVVSRKGKKVLLMGTGRDPDGKIVKYEWDFDGDGNVDWSSPDTGYVEHQFDQFSNAVLRVADADGGIGYDTLRVVICPDGMTPVKEGRFCIDEYEWPNQAGEIPMRQVSQREAAVLCAQAGKRLCTGAEWSMACGKSERHALAYPYGNFYDNDKCNTIGNAWGRNGPVRSGVLKDCVSPYGAADMSGNVAEWTTETYGSSAYAYGGSWQSGNTTSGCRSRMLFDAGSRFFIVGFRCCK